MVKPAFHKHLIVSGSILVVFLSWISLGPMASYAQSTIIGTDRAGAPVDLTIAGDNNVIVTGSADGINQIYTLDPNELQNVMVELQSPGLWSAKRAVIDGVASKSGIIDALVRIEAEQAAVLARFSNLARQVAKRGGGVDNTSLKVTHTYRTVMNGFALTASRGVIDEISSLPGVARVSPDGEVGITDAVSNAVIHADSARQIFGVSGEGVLIAIIDTGIDYTHPALGGAIGSGNKVVGGYDFVNDDADPVDDHYHGTHVAGIAAGDGQVVSGVAPAARLLAVKVLDHQGRGNDSDVIAGIEYAIDPDGDPLTDDGADIMNLSLGGPGHADSALSLAVDHASAAGYLMVVAAGNNGGLGDYSIQSPGSARLALTVGATDMQDQMARFSSRGPSFPGFDIKPDVVAPGVGILSADLNGGIRSASGTSMATPHVAGAAALLLELKPDWTPSAIKSAFVASSDEIDGSLFKTGSGRINTVSVLKTVVTSEPASVPFGAVDIESASHELQHKLVLRNMGDVPVAFDVMPLNMPNGSSLSLNPLSGVANPGDTLELTATLTVVPSAFSLPETGPPAYASVLLVQAGDDTLRIPFSFVFSDFLDITFNKIPTALHIYNSEGDDVAPPTGVLSRETSIPLPAGDYDLLSLFLNPVRLIHTEKVTVEGRTAVHVDTLSAMHHIALSATGVSGDSLVVDRTGILAEHTNGHWWYGNFTMGFLPDPDRPPTYINSTRLSDVSDDYTYHINSYQSPLKGEYYSGPVAALSGIDSDVSVSVSAGDYSAVIYDYSLQESSQDLLVKEWTCVLLPGGNSEICNSQWNDKLDSRSRIRSPYALRAFLTHQTSRFVTYYQASDFFETTRAYSTTDSLFFFQVVDYKPSYQIQGAPTVSLSVGQMAPRFRMRVNNSDANTASLSYPDAKGGAVWDALGNKVMTEIDYVVEQSGVVIDEGVFRHDFNERGSVSFNASGKNLLTAEFGNYFVNGEEGRGRIEYTFDLDNPSDRNSPYLKNVSILSDGQHRTALTPVSENVLSITVGDDEAIDPASLALQVKSTSDAVWVDAKFDVMESTMDAEMFREATVQFVLPDSMQAGYHDVRVGVSDAANNSLQYTLTPALYVDGLTAPRQYFPIGAITNVPLEPALDWEVIPEIPIYNVQISLDPSFSDLLERHTWVVTPPYLVPELTFAERYFWRVRGFDGDRFGAWSTAASFTTIAAHQDISELASPGNGDLDVVQPVFLQWTADGESDLFEIHIASDFEFKDTVRNSTTPESSLLVDQLASESAYFWRVRRVREGVGPGPWSGVFTFSTAISLADETVTSSGPEFFQLFQNYPNPFQRKTTFRLDLPDSGHTRLVIYDMLGRQVATLLDEVVPSGTHSIIWDANSIASGGYIYRVVSGQFSDSGVAVIVR